MKMIYATIVLLESSVDAVGELSFLLITLRLYLRKERYIMRYIQTRNTHDNSLLNQSAIGLKEENGNMKYEGEHVL